jgi:predicted dehydrogenase
VRRDRQADLGPRFLPYRPRHLWQATYLAEADHFVILDLGVHMLDVVRFLMGEATRLYCQAQSVKPGIRGEDMATIVLEHASGATTVVECSYASPIHPDPFPADLPAGGREVGQPAPESWISDERVLGRRSI